MLTRTGFSYFPKHKMINTISTKGMVILSGTSHPELVKLVCMHLNVGQGRCVVSTHSNKETKIELYETVRGRDVYIIQTATLDVNNDLMELMILAFACKAACARKIVVVMPYLPYCKQSKMRKRGSVTCKLICSMLCSTGIDHIITTDLHAKEIQGFFDVPVDNLRASPFLIKYIKESISDYRNSIIVALNPNGVARATSYAERLRTGLAVIHGEDREDFERTDGRYSPPPVELTESDRRTLPSFHAALDILPMPQAKEKPPLHVVGNVNGRIAIIVDDIIDDIDRYATAAELLHQGGAYKVYVVATHGILTSGSAKKIEESLLDEVVITNTIPHEVQKMQCHKIRTVDISPLIAEAIRRIHNNESMSYLFMNVPRND